MIDRHELLATLTPLVTQLEESIRERALAAPEVAAHLEQEHQKAVSAERTAMSLEEWSDGEITQAAVAWVLACVFVRFLEDNGLIDQALISGPGGRRAAALGYREEYFRAHPEHSDREYLEVCFRSVAAFPAVGPLYDERHNPIWRLAPTADGARRLRETFTAIAPQTGALVHDFTDAGRDTRFLGDLYQDLSKTARKRFALLQTPEFVESFILDRTLAPAIDAFGLDQVRLIDPACGSGHFVIGAFERLFQLWIDREPGTNASVLAQRALDQVAGVDLNPYATAITRFRLVMVALKACGIQRLAEAPAFSPQVVTGDSLLHGPLPVEGAPMLFDANRLNKNIAHVYESEDADELKEILGRGYHAVVGNPPYIAVQDSALRDAYRTRYASCHGHYVMTVPFMERFFELAQVRQEDGRVDAGFVGKITGNNFMKREFGAPLVERFLAPLDVQAVIDTSGAHIPGHGIPTVIILARSRPAVGETLRVVDGIKAEARQPVDPAHGAVWTSILEVVDEPGGVTPYVSSSDIARSVLFVHPMTLGPGRDLKARFDIYDRHVADVIEESGRTTHTGDDEAFYGRRGFERTLGIERESAPLVTGDAVRDWGLVPNTTTVFPYDRDTGSPLESLPLPLLRLMWPRRTGLAARKDFGQTPAERGLEWFEHSMLFPRRYRRERAIAWSFVATHNHFVITDGGALFKQSAPVLLLPGDASRELHIKLAAILNSSAACFWLKQVMHDRGGGGIGGGIAEEAWERFYEFTSARVEEVPLPTRMDLWGADELDRLGKETDRLLNPQSLAAAPNGIPEFLHQLRERDVEIWRRMISLQEELDWHVLAAYGLVSDDLVFGEEAPPTDLGERAFEIVLARAMASGEAATTWFERHGSEPVTDVPGRWPAEYRAVVEARIAMIETDADLALIEQPEHKRRWNRVSWEERQRDALGQMVLDALEERELWADVRLRSTAELADVLRMRPRFVEALEQLSTQKDEDLATTVRRLVLETAVPHLAAQRLTEKGLRKREVWESVWEAQRARDRGLDVSTSSVPPRYAQKDFRSSIFWRYRGKLDVPKERFVLVPSAERGADASPVVGWAGWDGRDLARALAGRVMELREQEAADAERLTPLLAGILELVPWIHQWHPDSDPLYGGPPGQYFEAWLDGQLAELVVTRDNLRAWRPPEPTRGRKAKAGAA